MRYLNKVVFINSADGSLPYAEVDLDGNVHFTGTQGVGKSTLLRAILFFYNADKQKLGIPRKKKKYDDYYFPYLNSHIIYEIQAETGAFCVMTFRRQGRVAFRFFDAEYDQDFFIDGQNKAFESWAKTREVLGKDIDYTRIISSYEEYRNILYGNNKGLPAKFRKYGLLHSKQYQNIPRTISNVFLNAKLDAEFVKETIIKSLNEEEITIDLTTYSQTHLKDFKTNLADLKKWTETGSRGGNPVQNQANQLIKTYRALNFLAQHKIDLAHQLGFALHQIHQQKPEVQDVLTVVETKRETIETKLAEQEEKFDKKKAKIQTEIGALSGKLKEIREKKKAYDAQNIAVIIKRIEKRRDWETERKNLTEEKDMLTAKFLDIKERFQAQLDRLENQFEEFKNRKTKAKNEKTQAFYNAKDTIEETFAKRFKNIENQHREEREKAESQVRHIGKSIHDKQLQNAEIKYKTYFQGDKESAQKEIYTLKSSLQEIDTVLKQARETRKNLEKAWELEEEGIIAEQERKIQKENEKVEQFKTEINGIDTKIKNSRHSFYDWLNKNVPHWDQSIGKVIDEDNVLFQSDLQPKLTADPKSFYGIEIDADKIPKKVKTLADLEEDRQNGEDQIQATQKKIQRLQDEQEHGLTKLKNRLKPKTKAQKEILETHRYKQQQNQQKLKKAEVELADLHKIAEAQKAKDLKQIKKEISRLNEEKIQAGEEVKKVETRIHRKTNTQKREKTAQIHNEKEGLIQTLAKIDDEIKARKAKTDKAIKSLQTQQQQELQDKGADTARLAEIDSGLGKIEKELTYIENNRDKVADYNKDKRELFDKEGDFKTERKSLKSSLDKVSEKFRQDKEKWTMKLTECNQEINRLRQKLESFKNNEHAFENFKKTDVYESIADELEFSEDHKTDAGCSALIKELHTKDNTYNKRYINLRDLTQKFTGHFDENNIFNFKVKLTTEEEFFEFAENLEEFIEEEKIQEYKKRVETRFADIIRRIGTETNELRAKEGEISKVIRDINNDFRTRNFVGAIKRMELKTDESTHTIYQLLLEITKFNEEHAFNIGSPDLFSTEGQGDENEKAIRLLDQLVREVDNSRSKEIKLSDSFELLFRIVENDNGTGWVEKLSNVGSQGTDVLAKAMINIMLLNVFKERATKKKKNDFGLHCMMDEVGRLHPNNVRGILQFANDRNILLINSSPISQNATDYRYTYHLSKDKMNLTSVKKLIRVN